MNTNAHLLASLAVGIAVIALAASILPHTVHAASGGSQQYKVLQFGGYQGPPSPQEMEAQLNGLAADGWQVRTAMAAPGLQVVILAKDK